MKLLVFLLLSCGLCGRIYAQEKTQLIHGLITDPDLKAVAGMQVSLHSNGAYNQYTKTDSNGYFYMPLADTGYFHLSFRMANTLFETKSFRIQPNDSILVNIAYRNHSAGILRYNQSIENEIPIATTRILPQRNIGCPERYYPIVTSPDKLHHRDAEMILRNWQMGASGNLHLNLRPLNPNQ